MKNFRNFKESLQESNKFKIGKYNVEIKKVGKMYKTMIDGEHLDNYSSEKEAEKMAKEFVKQFKG